MSDLGENFKHIKGLIEAAALRAGRLAGSVELTAVSKTQGAEVIAAALRLGQLVYGENRVQEAQAKFADLRAWPGLRLHLIGPLQTNKAEAAVKLFDVIETLDRPALAGALAKASAKTGRRPDCYIEVNIGQEPQKAGIAPGEVTGFLAYCREQAGLTITGLMCIPPHEVDPVPYFKHMRDLQLAHHLPQLSMGMSADFEAAIACGATRVRVGSALFGQRFVSQDRL